VVERYGRRAFGHPAALRGGQVNEAGLRMPVAAFATRVPELNGDFGALFLHKLYQGPPGCHLRVVPQADVEQRIAALGRYGGALGDNQARPAHSAAP
jgi:hypothetical protein